jgi:hypothetical protein
MVSTIWSNFTGWWEGKSPYEAPGCPHGTRKGCVRPDEKGRSGVPEADPCISLRQGRVQSVRGQGCMSVRAGSTKPLVAR